MDETLLKGIELSIEINSKLAKEYFRRAKKYELEGNEQHRCYWFVNYMYVKGYVDSLNKHREQLLREES